MRFLDRLLGRDPPPRSGGAVAVDGVLAVPAAADVLRASLGLRPADAVAVALRPYAGGDFVASHAELTDVMRRAAHRAGCHLTQLDHADGDPWILAHGAHLDELVTAVHLVGHGLADSDAAPRPRTAVFAFEGRGQPVYLVYAYDRGSFYPWAPTHAGQRDTQLERQARQRLEPVVPVELDATHCPPVWDVPIP